MEQVKPKRAALFAIAACLIGMVIGLTVTLAVLSGQRAIPSSGSIVAVPFGIFPCSEAATLRTFSGSHIKQKLVGHSLPTNRAISCS